MTSIQDKEEIYTIINMQRESISIISNMCDAPDTFKVLHNITGSADFETQTVMIYRVLYLHSQILERLLKLCYKYKEKEDNPNALNKKLRKFSHNIPELARIFFNELNLSDEEEQYVELVNLYYASRYLHLTELPTSDLDNSIENFLNKIGIHKEYDSFRETYQYLYNTEYEYKFLSMWSKLSGKIISLLKNIHPNVFSYEYFNYSSAFGSEFNGIYIKYALYFLELCQSKGENFAKEYFLELNYIKKDAAEDFDDLTFMSESLEVLIDMFYNNPNFLDTVSKEKLPFTNTFDFNL